MCPQPWVVIPGRCNVQVNPFLSLSQASGGSVLQGPGWCGVGKSLLTTALWHFCAMGAVSVLAAVLQQCLHFILLLCLVSARAGSLSLLAPVYIASFVSMHLFIICLCCTDCSLRWLPLFHGIGIFSFISPFCFGSHFFSTVASSFICVHHYLW